MRKEAIYSGCKNNLVCKVLCNVVPRLNLQRENSVPNGFTVQSLLTNAHAADLPHFGDVVHSGVVRKCRLLVSPAAVSAVCRLSLALWYRCRSFPAGALPVGFPDSVGFSEGLKSFCRCHHIMFFGSTGNKVRPTQVLQEDCSVYCFNICTR